MSQQFLTIAPRFCGPPNSGNGGYVAGMLAHFSRDTLRIRLHQPPPLNTPLLVERDAAGGVQLKLQSEIVASGVPDRLSLDVPAAPNYVEALRAARNYPGFQYHLIPGCFVCGPQRARGDGLRIFATAIAERGLVAAPWMPDESISPSGKVLPEFMWAALDCPGYFAAFDDNRSALLGEFTAHVDRLVHTGESCVVIGWKVGAEGRKHRVGTALFDGNGELCARALATWIELKAPL
ncbi:MAG TPA: hypothetical protein VE046_13935 [Steroidobacteraceae bacterium]|nr:hypothetical protein [Steroidobacteraceae bacterium]